MPRPKANLERVQVFHRIHLATAEVSDKVFKAAAVAETPVYRIVRKLEITHLQHGLVMFDGIFFVGSAHIRG